MNPGAPKLVAVSATNAAEEVDLVRRAQRGDSVAQHELFSHYAPRVAGLLRRSFGRDAPIDDMTQEALIAGYAGLSRLKNPAAFRPWLFRLAIFQAKRTMWRARFFARWQREQAALWSEEDLAPSLSADARACLVAAGRRLAGAPDELRIPWVLRHTCGMNIQEVSLACNVSLATAKRRLAAAQEYLEGSIDA